ncbi:hypothetical protein A3724_00285 [Alcanivorax sp. HI0033]|jgi:hypothetical protein|uniref:hypothetical protein n=1 Tax=unclassified Alcanivorax TaxID=2638842 RepID=UPI0007B8ECD0|nr:MULTISPECIES: hypothetical protein [unclassified Alcanivorax]KZX75414.1 hypothetical protein A3717_02620 [Alcanivorax sp. HI0013]KZX76703.1 hypothetical protein A3716_01280 [Alcanivorax sp. HI0011]KZY13157.1 hypothetical protein A3725_01955 [Alcanivorax sp. HI0035]KZX65610.1 hypothetical protein A3713_04025 [Alcanivorax sp. HI0003]KZX71100.1 hypothetical protein A3714_06460 [Alcanivorax sp. HI0007]
MKNREYLPSKIELLSLDCVNSFSSGSNGEKEQKIISQNSPETQLNSLWPMGKKAFDYLLENMEIEGVDTKSNEFIYYALSGLHTFVLTPLAFALVIEIYQGKANFVVEGSGASDWEEFRKIWWTHDYVGQAHFFTQNGFRDIALDEESRLPLVFAAAILWGLDTAMVCTDFGGSFPADLILEMNELFRFINGEYKQIRSLSAQKAARGYHAKNTAPEKNRARELFIHYRELPNFQAVSRSEMARKISEDPSITKTIRTITDWVKEFESM